MTKTTDTSYRLASYRFDDGTRPVLLRNGQVLDVARHAESGPASMNDLLAMGNPWADELARTVPLHTWQPFLMKRLAAPVPRPGKILAVGLNYHDHVQEMGRETTGHPTWFSKPASAVTGPFDPIERPLVSEKVDYEGEICLVVGSGGRHINGGDALQRMAGFCIGNDVTVRDWQRRTSQFVIGKGFDTHAPMGPWITPVPAIKSPTELTLQTVVNDVLKQSSTAAHMIFDFASLIVDASKAMTLEPGDIIFTGTPAGVAAGSDNPVFLKAGDRVRVSSEGLGYIDNPVINEVTFPDLHKLL